MPIQTIYFPGVMSKHKSFYLFLFLFSFVEQGHQIGSLVFSPWGLLLVYFIFFRGEESGGRLVPIQGKIRGRYCNPYSHLCECRYSNT